MAAKELNVEKFEDYNAEMHRVTVESIQQATLQLLNEKSMEKISVKEIVALAGVSRSAFYRNYASKEDVLSDIIQNSFDRIIYKVENVADQSFMKIWEQVMFFIVQDNMTIYELIANGKWKSDHMLYAMNRFNRKLQCLSQDAHQKRRFCFIGGGFYNVIIAWIQEGKKEPLEEVIHEVSTFI